MPPATLDVVGVGNAIVDVLAEVDDDFIHEHGLARGAMTLIDRARAVELYAAMPSGLEESGGSAANTMVGVASFGGRAAYIGRVADDFLGELFRRDLRQVGVAFDVPGVVGCHDLRTRVSGTRWFVQMHLELPGELPLIEAHALCDAVETAIHSQYPRAEVLVHADPLEVVKPRPSEPTERP